GEKDGFAKPVADVDECETALHIDQRVAEGVTNARRDVAGKERIVILVSIEFNAGDASRVVSVYRSEAMEIAVQRQGTEVHFDTVKPAAGALEVIAELAAAEAVGGVELFATDIDGLNTIPPTRNGERSGSTLDLRPGDAHVGADIEAGE